MSQKYQHETFYNEDELSWEDDDTQEEETVREYLLNPNLQITAQILGLTEPESCDFLSEQFDKLKNDDARTKNDVTNDLYVLTKCNTTELK